MRSLQTEHCFLEIIVALRLLNLKFVLQLFVIYSEHFLRNFRSYIYYSNVDGKITCQRFALETYFDRHLRLCR